MDSLIAQIPCLVGSSQPLLLVYTVLHKGWISEQTVSVSGVRNVPALLPISLILKMTFLENAQNPNVIHFVWIKYD